MAQQRFYFAAASRKEIGLALQAKLDKINAAEQGLDHREEMANAYGHVYGRDMGYGLTWGVTRGGEHGELAQVRMNSATSYARAKLAIATTAAVNWRPLAKNGDAGVMAATSLSRLIMEDEWETNQLNTVNLRWVWQAIIYAEGFVFPEWDMSAGPPMGATAERLIRAGAITYHNIPPWLVRRDNTSKSYKDCQWHFVSVLKNRWDLAALCHQLPDGRQGDAARDAILDAGESVRDRNVEQHLDIRASKDTDLIPVQYFFHRPSATLPLGREVIFINGDTVLSDRPMVGPNSTYDGVPLYRIAEQERDGTPHAWAPFWDILGGQEINDGIDTTLSTIVTTLGNPIISHEKGAGPLPGAVGAGFNVWERPPGTQAPEAVQTAQFPPDAMKYKDSNGSAMKQIMGLNDVALGQPQTAQMNAQAFAVLASMAVQQASPLQKAWLTGLSALGTGVLRTLRKRVTREREIRVTGKGSKNLNSIIKYSGEELACVEGVYVSIGNPLEQSPAGKKTILDDKIGLGFVTTPEQYDQVLETGRMEPVSRRARDETNLIEWEYEQIQQGINPPVLYIHDHVRHFRENSAALLSPDVQGDPKVLTSGQAHLDEHYLQQFGMPREADPMRLVRERWLLGQQVDPTQQMQPMGAPMPGMPGEPPPPGAEAGAPMAPPGAPPEPPEMPPNPMTGQQFDPTTGGGVVPTA